MSLFNNKYIQFSLYRDMELQAFYDIDTKYRWSIIFAHMMIHFLPILVIIFYFWSFFGNSFIWQVLAVSLIFYLAIILETVAYLFPSSRKVFKRYFLWMIIPLAILCGYSGYIIGIEIIASESEINRPGMLFAGISGGFGIFVWTYMGMSLILKASRAIYTKKADIEADVRFATEVQERILQDISIAHNSSKAYATSVPANELGGDFFELSRHNQTLFASIGDVSGHSFGAGLLMTMTKSAVQTHLEYNHHPSKIMEALNEMFSKQSDRAMYATMSLLKLDLSALKVDLSNAGHLPVLHFIASENTLKHRHKKGLGLGLVDKAEYEDLRFTAKKGDLIFLYSDGLIETRDEHSKIRDPDFFEEVVFQTIQKPFENPEELSNRIFTEVRKADHSEKFEDDATLIIIEI
ncbi:MAG: PP2C family protein-serine/threonine phosphatase [Balneolaceae bacterium]|nr:PP2C family protein-serine/threonine phosphatase [Balneolaceae bacterium]MDR9410138.1 PP2C family protein-serine/threonine phosphatase [Balneolaceae bacterium]